MATKSPETTSAKPSNTRGNGIRALWLAAVGVVMGLLLFLGIAFDRIPFAMVAFLFFGAPLVEIIALILGLWAGRGTAVGRFAAGIAVLYLGGWGYLFYTLMTRPLIRLF